jgi:hypothetical protein
MLRREIHGTTQIAGLSQSSRHRGRRAAGYANPERSAPKLMAMPAIRKAIAEKQRAIIEASGVRIWAPIISRLLELANLPPHSTRYNINGPLKP